MEKTTVLKRSSIKTIAAICNVSAMTVSRALRGIEGVSETKRSEIRRVAEEQNYVLNSNARSLVKASSDLVGISVPTLFNDVFADMLEGMRRTFEKADISTVVNTTDYNNKFEADWVERLMSWRPAGIVLTGVDHSPQLAKTIRAIGIPTVEIWDISDDPIDFCVGINHYDAGLQLGKLAVDLGYSRPGYVCSPIGIDNRADQRLAGVRDAFQNSTLSAPLLISSWGDRNSFLAGRAGTMDLCSGLVRPDVIFYVNDHVAFGGLAACEEMGLKVPKEIGLIGFNNLDVNSVIRPKLTTAYTPRRIMGEVAARNLLARLNGISVPQATVLDVSIEMGGTTCPQTK